MGGPACVGSRVVGLWRSGRGSWSWLGAGVAGCFEEWYGCCVLLRVHSDWPREPKFLLVVVLAGGGGAGGWCWCWRVVFIIQVAE